jgi:hypothetical protein
MGLALRDREHRENRDRAPRQERLVCEHAVRTLAGVFVPEEADEAGDVGRQVLSLRAVQALAQGECPVGGGCLLGGRSGRGRIRHARAKGRGGGARGRIRLRVSQRDALASPRGSFAPTWTSPQSRP